MTGEVRQRPSWSVLGLFRILQFPEIGNRSDVQRRSIWCETDSGMTDGDDGDSLWDTSFKGIGYALQGEMLDEVTRAAWQDAEELEKAAAKRPPRGRGVPSRE